MRYLVSRVPFLCILGLVGVLSFVVFFAGTDERVGEFAYVVGRATSAVCFTLAMLGLAVALPPASVRPVARPDAERRAQKF